MFNLEIIELRQIHIFGDLSKAISNKLKLKKLCISIEPAYKLYFNLNSFSSLLKLEHIELSGTNNSLIYTLNL